MIACTPGTQWKILLPWQSFSPIRSLTPQVLRLHDDSEYSEDAPLLFVRRSLTDEEEEYDSALDGSDIVVGELDAPAVSRQPTGAAGGSRPAAGSFDAVGMYHASASAAAAAGIRGSSGGGVAGAAGRGPVKPALKQAPSGPSGEDGSGDESVPLPPATSHEGGVHRHVSFRMPSASPDPSLSFSGSSAAASDPGTGSLEIEHSYDRDTPSAPLSNRCVVDVQLLQLPPPPWRAGFVFRLQPLP